MNSPKVKSIKPLENKQLLIQFDNGSEKIYDCNPLLEMDRFQLLKHDAFFKAVNVDTGGYGISWDDETDLSEYELWVNGKEITQVI